MGGAGGIRTLEPLRAAGFQDRCIRPLCHRSVTSLPRSSGLSLTQLFGPFWCPISLDLEVVMSVRKKRPGYWEVRVYAGRDPVPGKSPSMATGCAPEGRIRMHLGAASLRVARPQRGDRGLRHGTDSSTVRMSMQLTSLVFA